MTDAPMPRLNRREAAKLRTRQRVVDAATALFKEVGYEKATIRAIAKRTGMSTGAVFANFENKAELWTEIMKLPPPCDSALYRASGLLLEEVARACHDAKVRFIRMVREDGFDVTTYAEAVEAWGSGSAHVEHLEALISKAETPLPFEVAHAG